MSLFDFPRINIKGTVTLNPGTANNDDYAGNAFLPNSWGAYAGQTLGLMDSKRVQPRTFGMSDADFIQWVQRAQAFDTAGGPSQVIPAEWNYYGNFASSVGAGKASVIGVQTAPDKLYTAADPGVPVTSLIGSPLTYNGGITDVNSEGSPPATQFFIEQLTLMNGAATALRGPASKGACQWINFYRNVNQQADAGAGGYMYHVMLKSKCPEFNIPGFEDASIVGAIFRYYLYNIAIATKDNAGIEKRYEQPTLSAKQNPGTLQFVATIAPLYANEELFTGPVGRLLTASTPAIKTPTPNNNGGGTVALAPAVLQLRDTLLSAEFVGTFPDNYRPATGTNEKFDFGPVTLVVDGGGASVTIGAVDYANTSSGDQRGWLFDFDLSQNAAAQKALADPKATFRLVSKWYADVLNETPYYIVSNQQAIYGEQYGPGDMFVNQGTTEPVTISVYQYGKPLLAGDCPPITVWSYSTVPMQASGSAVAIQVNVQPGDPLRVDTSLPGNFLFTFTVGSTAPPTQSYNNFMNPPYVTNAPQISMRILPNEENFSQYYVDPTAPEPVGNDLLTFDIVYAKVLRTYYLLYPAMNFVFALNSESDVQENAEGILERTDPKLWMSTKYMPKTRDMSASRRTLLQAWCRKFIPPPS